MIAIAKTRTSLKEQPQWLQEAILIGNEFHYRKKNPLLHNTINLSLFFLLISIGLAVCYLSRFLSFIVYLPLATILFGWLHFVFFILVIHEASHNMFIILRNHQRAKKINRCFGWLICTIYRMDYYHYWEVGHLVHHHSPLIPDDPQGCPEILYSGKRLLKYAIKVLSIPGYLQFFNLYGKCNVTKEYGFNIKLVVGNLLIWAGFIVSSILYLSWTVPVAAFVGIQVTSVFNQLKIAMEHDSRRAERVDNYFLRSCTSLFPLRHIVMPLNISIHFEHHLNYCVPWYDLLRYHQRLLPVVPKQIQKQVFHQNRQVWQQLNYSEELS